MRHHAQLTWIFLNVVFITFFFFFFSVPGVEPRGVLPLRYTPGPIFLYFILKPGLTKLRRASLGRERERDWERERERESERAEAGREPGSSGLCLPKYWDYKRAPPRPALYS